MCPHVHGDLNVVVFGVLHHFVQTVPGLVWGDGWLCARSDRNQGVCQLWPHWASLEGRSLLTLQRIP